MTNESVSGEMSIFCYLPKTLHSHSINPAYTLSIPKSLHYKPENIRDSTLLETYHWYVRSLNISNQSLDSCTGLWTNEQRLPQQNARVLDTSKQLRRTFFWEQGLHKSPGVSNKWKYILKAWRRHAHSWRCTCNVSVLSKIAQLGYFVVQKWYAFYFY